MIEDDQFLLKYQGGGYDGCIWEWNFLLMDNEDPQYATHMEVIRASGRLGITTLDALHAFDVHAPGAAVYNLKNAKSTQKLQEEVAAALYVSVALWLAENADYELTVCCDACGDTLTAYEVVLTDVKHQGGIVYMPTKKVCRDCHVETQWTTWIQQTVVECVADLPPCDLPDAEYKDALYSIFFGALHQVNGYIDNDGDVCGLEDALVLIHDNYACLLQRTVCQDHQLELTTEEGNVVWKS